MYAVLERYLRAYGSYICHRHFSKSSKFHKISNLTLTRFVRERPNIDANFDDIVKVLKDDKKIKTLYITVFKDAHQESDLTFFLNHAFF